MREARQAHTQLYSIKMFMRYRDTGAHSERLGGVTFYPSSYVTAVALFQQTLAEHIYNCTLQYQQAPSLTPFNQGMWVIPFMRVPTCDMDILGLNS